MKIFKNIDEKLEEIGFKKIEENQYVVSYERVNDKYNYIHVLDFLHKTSGRYIVQSYVKDLFDVNNIGNCCVGVTYYEAKLITKKFKKLLKKWK